MAEKRERKGRTFHVREDLLGRAVRLTESVPRALRPETHQVVSRAMEIGLERLEQDLAAGNQDS